MKNVIIYKLISLLTLIFCFPDFSKSQEMEGPAFTPVLDFYSSYIWRGTQYGSGLSVQPLIKFSSGILSAGG